MHLNRYPWLIAAVDIDHLWSSSLWIASFNLNIGVEKFWRTISSHLLLKYFFDFRFDPFLFGRAGGLSCKILGCSSLVTKNLFIDTLELLRLSSSSFLVLTPFSVSTMNTRFVLVL
jgi:hypothetical protein